MAFRLYGRRIISLLLMDPCRFVGAAKASAIVPCPRILMLIGSTIPTDRINVDEEFTGREFQLLYAAAFACPSGRSKPAEENQNHDDDQDDAD
jgi:hypothetical protein